MRRLLLIFLFGIVISLIHNFVSASEEINYIIITSKEIEGPVFEWEKNIKNIIPEARPKELDYNSSEAKEWIERLGINFIPYIIFEKKIEQSDKFFELVRSGMIEKKVGEYVVPERLFAPIGVMLFRREKIPYRIDLFLMSYCPAGKDAQRQMGNYIEKNPNSFKVVCRYITKFREFGIDSFHGPDEIKEDIHQLLIQKYHPDKFWEYLKRYHEGKGFEVACGELEIDSSELMQRKAEGITFLEEDFNLCKELGINFSPTILLQNQILLASMNIVRGFLSQLQAEATRPTLQTLPIDKVSPVATEIIPIKVFYSTTCSHCQWMLDEYIPKLEKKFGNRIAFEYYDITIQENFEKRLKVEEEFGVVGGAIPEVLVGERVLVGRHEIEDELESILEKMIGTKYTSNIEKTTTNLSQAKTDVGSTKLIERFKLFTPFAIGTAGLLDGINPCAFSTIVFFLSFLAFTGFNVRQIFFVGLSFTLGVFFTYLALGLGAFAGLERLRVFDFFSKYFDTTVGGLAILLGIGSLFDYIYFRKTGKSEGMLLQLPRSVKNTIHKSIGIMRERGQARLLKLLFIAFSLGVIVSLLESMCTGQIYLPTLAFILKMKVMWWRAFLFLLLYNAMFILPLVIVLLLTIYGVGTQWWASLVHRNLGKVKLVTALFFFGLGVFILLI
jgi:thiol-disulfide isomerase/thioredoxin